MTSTERMRRRRERLRAHTRIVMFELFEDDIDGLTALGQITNADEMDQQSMSAAVADYLTDAIRRDLRKCDASQGAPGNVPSSHRSDSEAR